MDSKRFNIYAGSILGGLLLFLLLNFFSTLIYHGPEHADHGEEVLAFAVPVEDAGAGGEPEEVDLAALAAEADPAAGERVFNKCKACHAVEQGKHGVGPSLHGTVGAEIAAIEGFAYSDALTSLEGEWGLENLSAFLENPSGYAPGTKMAFAGLPKPEDRVNVIAYLNETSDSPIELAPERTAEESAQAEEPEQGAEAGEAQEQAGQEQEGQEQAAEQTAEQEEGQEQAAEQAEPEQAEAAQAEAAQEEAPQNGDAGEYAELLANASAENGEKVYRKCQACHTLDEGKHRVGPSLHGVIGGDIGGAEGFNYSDAMANFEGDWTLENLMGYLENPKDFMPGNKMTFPGLKDPQERIDVLTYIDAADGERGLPQ